MWAHPDTMQNVRRALRGPLTAEEQVVRDMALGHLTRKEMLNLLTRRLWCTVQWAWGGRRASRDRAREYLATALPALTNSPAALPAPVNTEDRP
jgi:hypothetical protein